MKGFILTWLLLPTILFAQDMSGHWVWTENSGAHQFSLMLSEHTNDTYKATYCAVGSSGARIDCSRNNANEFVFVFGHPFSFRSHYSGANGEAVIEQREEGLVWEITIQPRGEHYAPKFAPMVRFN